jgi:hypothetical protein
VVIVEELAEFAMYSFWMGYAAGALSILPFLLIVSMRLKTRRRLHTIAVERNR